MEMPSRIRALPRDSAGRPIPWFVATIDGTPDFRVIRPNGINDAIMRRSCWVCGQRRAHGDAAFVIGPMCAVNRTSAEPSSHLTCARYSALACPFLSNPNKERRTANLPDHEAPAGAMIARNPGVTLLWVPKRYRGWGLKTDGAGGTLFDIGEPQVVEWYARGRQATRDEVLDSIDSGLPILRAMAVEEGPDALAYLDRLYSSALELVPA